MQFLHGTRETLKTKGIQLPLVIGLQKTGQLVDFGNLIADELTPGTCFAVTDEFREKYAGTAA